MREFLNQFSPAVWPAIVNINITYIYTNQIYIYRVIKRKTQGLSIFSTKCSKFLFCPDFRHKKNKI